MRRPIIFFATLTLLVSGFIFTAVWQRQAGATTRAELGSLRDQQQERARLEAENARLRASQISSVDLESLRGDRAALTRLRGEIETLRRQAYDPARVATARAEEEARPPKLSILETQVRASEWRNAGTATPVATLETVLWAAAGGDVDKLASLLVFDPGVRAKAEALLAGLPEATRKEYGTPERLIAALTAKDVPLGMAQIFDPKAEDASGRHIVVNLLPPTGAGARFMAVSLRQEGSVWKLGVPASAVEKYAAMLKGTEAGAGK